MQNQYIKPQSNIYVIESQAILAESGISLYNAKTLDGENALSRRNVDDGTDEEEIW